MIKYKRERCLEAGYVQALGIGDNDNCKHHSAVTCLQAEKHVMHKAQIGNKIERIASNMSSSRVCGQSAACGHANTLKLLTHY